MLVWYIDSCSLVIDTGKEPQYWLNIYIYYMTVMNVTAKSGVDARLWFQDPYAHLENDPKGTQYRLGRGKGNCEYRYIDILVYCYTVTVELMKLWITEYICCSFVRMTICEL
jgi:hypothetical protein